EALINFNKALEVNSSNTYVLALRGEIYLKFQQYGNTFLDLKILPEFNTNNALQKFINTLLFHGESHYSLEQYNKALLYYNKVLEIVPYDLTALFFRGKIYYSLGRFYKAFLNLNEALEINPLDMTTLLYRGETYFKL